MKKILYAFAGFAFFFCVSTAHAAKVGQVIVNQASIYLYPQTSSNVISKLTRGSAITVSNLPTEGFYKVRLPSGDIGWISGNDILVGDGGGSINPGPQRRKRTTRHRDEEDEDDGGNEVSSDEDSFRAIVSYGVASLNYTNLSTYYSPQSGLNLGKTFGIDLQFRMNSKLFWMIRVETYNADTGSIATTSTLDGGATNQDTKVSIVPIELGFMLSPISTHRFRFGIGALIGATVSESTTITQDNGATIQNVSYGSTDFVAEAVVQMSIGLGDLLGIVLDANYRYDKTGTTPTTSKIHANTPGFQIDYSGIAVRLGLEIRI